MTRRFASMTFYLTIAAIALTAAASTVSFAKSGDDAKPAVGSATLDDEAMAQNTKAAGAFLKMAEDAGLAMRDIRIARVAIFNGATADGLAYAQAALLNLDHAKAAMSELQVDTRKQAPEGDAYLPFDSSVIVAEGFAPEDTKAQAIDQANDALAAGDEAGAAETLKLANIDVTVSAAFLPVASSYDHVKDAVDLMRDGKYYEANLALKAVEDSAIVESYGTSALPTQGSNDSASDPGAPVPHEAAKHG